MLVWWFEKCERLMEDSLYLYYLSSLWNHDGGNIGSLTSRGPRGACGVPAGDILRLLDPAVIVPRFVDLRNHVELPFWRRRSEDANVLKL